MFLYWRKRGAYELEALPGDLGQLELGAVERFSWSSALDIIEDLGAATSGVLSVPPWGPRRKAAATRWTEEQKIQGSLRQGKWPVGHKLMCWNGVDSFSGPGRNSRCVIPPP